MLWERLRRLKRDGVTQVLTTHYMDEAERLCDRLVLLDKGKIIAEGTPPELIGKHIGKDVLELTFADGNLEGAAQTLAAGEARVEQRHGLLLCYAEDGEAALRRARSAGLPFETARLRRASLEDVLRPSSS
jgi:lipooligosaccharide transport system ATP-binding protein